MTTVQSRLSGVSERASTGVQLKGGVSLKTTIHWPARVERDPGGDFRVIPFHLTECAGTAPTREDAQKRAVAQLAERLSKRRNSDGRPIAMLKSAVKLSGVVDGQVVVDLIVTFDGGGA